MDISRESEKSWHFGLSPNNQGDASSGSLEFSHNVPGVSRTSSAGPIPKANLSKEVEEKWIRIALDCSVKVFWSALKASTRKPLKGDFGEDVPRQTSDAMTKPEMLRLLQLPRKACEIIPPISPPPGPQITYLLIS